MKSVIYFLLLFTFNSFGQVYYMGYKGDDPSPKDFPVDRNSIDIYEYTFIDGKLKDSSIYKQLDYNRQSNIIYCTLKIRGELSMTQDYMQYDKSIYKYDLMHRVIFKRASRLIELDTGGYLFATKDENFFYNNNVMASYKILEKKLWYDLGETDTIFSSAILDRKKYEIFYKDTLLTNYYTAEDFTGIYNYENGALKDSTVYAYPRYQNSEYIYNETGDLLSENIYARDNRLMSKLLFVYDRDNRLKKEYSTTGLYDNRPNSSLSRTYHYMKDGSKKEIRHLDDSRYVTVYDSRGNQTLFRQISDGKLTQNDKTNYFYEHSKLAKVNHIDTNGASSQIIYSYDKNGFIIEETLTTSQKKSIMRYFYK